MDLRRGSRTGYGPKGPEKTREKNEERGQDVKYVISNDNFHIYYPIYFPQNLTVCKVNVNMSAAKNCLQIDLIRKRMTI